MPAQVVANSHSTVPNLMGGFLVTYPRDRIRTILIISVFARIKFIPAALLIGFWFLTRLFNAGSVVQVPVGRRGLPGAHRRLALWVFNGASPRRATANRITLEAS